MVMSNPAGNPSSDPWAVQREAKGNSDRAKAAGDAQLLQTYQGAMGAANPAKPAAPAGGSTAATATTVASSGAPPRTDGTGS